MERQELYTLEELIDKHGLGHLLDALADICSEKAEHVRASYDARHLARLWEKDAKSLTSLAARVNN